LAEAETEVAFERGLAGIERPDNLSELIRGRMYNQIIHPIPRRNHDLKLFKHL